ncbi:MAG: methyltransferase domain-containing protein [Alphaproteobacteria bacterium]|nr:methyltransferase domain-containing protein [Alphaproteobacteria bacterium]
MRVPFPPARLQAELAGWHRLEGHPGRPALREIREDALLIEPLGPPPADPVAAVTAWAGGTAFETTAPVASMLGPAPDSPLSGTARVDRTLVRLGLKRRALDRLMASPIRVSSRSGPSFGGLHSGWLRTTADGRPVGLGWRGATRSGWSAQDLAATALSSGVDLREVHAIGLTDEDAADRAYDLALLRVACERVALLRDDAAAAAALAAFERLRDAQQPDRARVFIEGPAWLDTRPWLPPDGRVDAGTARRLLRQLDGLAVGGQVLRVRTEPPLRPAAARPHREDRLTRRRRLFSRWSEGIQVDDEGLLSATPEALALAMSEGLRGVVLDGTCGVGAWAIAAARQPEVSRVIAVDLHAGRLAMARHNAGLYGVAERIDFVCGDTLEALRQRPCDALLLDPPWGGRDYDRQRVTLDDLGMDLRPLLAAAPERVVLKLPRSFNTATLPGDWRWSAAVDARGVLKLLVARRGP